MDEALSSDAHTSLQWNVEPREFVQCNDERAPAYGVAAFNLEAAVHQLGAAIVLPFAVFEVDMVVPGTRFVERSDQVVVPLTVVFVGHLNGARRLKF